MQPSKKTPARVIRTFEEVEVHKTIVSEEWYDELECGMYVRQPAITDTAVAPTSCKLPDKWI